MERGLVSIIIPVYNKEKYLSVCLESILKQTYKNIEVIIIDDGSTDDSGKICDQFAKMDSRIVALHKKNGGVGQARNLGLEAAQGEYIQFADADDYLDPHMTETLYSLIKETDSDLALCGYHQVLDGITKHSVYPSDGQKLTLKDYYELIHRYGLDPVCGSPCNRLFRNQIIREHNLKYSSSATYAEDFAFNLQYIQHIDHFAATSACLYYYNMDVPGSLYKATQVKLDDRWRQQCEFDRFFSQITKETGMDKYYPALAANISFEHFYNAVNDRIVRKYKIRDISEWIYNEINNKELDISKVHIDYSKVYSGPNKKSIKAKDQKIKLLLFCIKHRMIPLYVIPAKLLAHLKEK